LNLPNYVLDAFMASTFAVAGSPQENAVRESSLNVSAQPVRNSQRALLLRFDYAFTRNVSYKFLRRPVVTGDAGSWFL